MQIQLKQAEIEAALRMFISGQGISLAGKAVSVTFTSGRKDNGLSAEMTIEDSTLQPATPSVAPDSTGSLDEPVKPTASLFTK